MKTDVRKNLPELALTCIVVYYWALTYLFNPVAIGLLALLILQLILKNKTAGRLLGGLFLFLSLWMVLAFISDLRKPWNPEGSMKFIIYGTLFCVSLFGSSVFMMIKYVRMK